MEREVDIYTTIQRDMWDGMSFKIYGADKYSRELLKANPQHMNIAIFGSGVEIICPEISKEKGSTLPPWR